MSAWRKPPLASEQSARGKEWKSGLRCTSWRLRARSKWIGGLLALVVGVVFVFPYYWIILTSLDNASQVFTFPPRLFPGTDFGNFLVAWSAAPWAQYFLNTILISVVTVALAMLTSVLAGFALGVMRFPGRQLLFGFVLSMLMIPWIVIVIPDYIILKDLHWLNTYQAQIVPFGASVFGIFLLRQFFIGLPRELVEAAELDGASQMGFLWKVALPLARPALVTVALYVFITMWDSFLWPFIMTSSSSVQPIEVGLANFFGVNNTQWSELMAAVVFTTLPVMIVFLFAQRLLVEGVVSAGSGVKG